MSKKGFISISKKLHYFSLILTVSLVAIFMLTQYLVGWFQSSSTEVFLDYSRFSKYWNEMQEADRVLYSYAQTPIEGEKEKCSSLLNELNGDAAALAAALDKAEMKDLTYITEKYVQVGRYILDREAGPEERISWYNTLNEYKWILDGIYDTLYEEMQDYLETEQKMLEQLWQKQNALTVVLGIGMIGLFVWWIHRLGRQIIRPVQELTAQTEEIIGGNRSIEMNYHKTIRDELDILNNSFYRMVETNNRNYDRLQRQGELEKRLARTKLRLLQSRVNPHFLFNTLNLIAGLAVEEDAEKTTEMLMKTAKYLRYALVCLDKAVRLEDEIGHAMDYMNIQKVRFEERFQVEFQAEEESKRAVVPSMILQPLCENALSYGMEPLKRTTTIRICAGVEGERLVLSVEDDGAGMEGQRLEEVRERLNKLDEYDDTRGIGVANTLQRLQSFYRAINQEEDGLVACSVESEPMVRTRICFTLPLVYLPPSEVQAMVSEQTKE